MLSMNIVGRISREIRTNILPNGSKVANVPVAINLVNAAGKQSDKTLFAEIACWGNLADKVQNAVVGQVINVESNFASIDTQLRKIGKESKTFTNFRITALNAELGNLPHKVAKA